MTAAAAARLRQRWLAPEVVQTSTMDCGPATLKCLLEGYGIRVSYGRLREACQTDVDGTCIDTLEEVSSQLGVPVEQISIPLDHIFLPTAAALPAIVVTRHRDGSLHFVVVWRRHGRWLQVMDPSIGRRWVTQDAFSRELYRHAHGVAGGDWRSWAESQDGLAPLRERMARVGTGAGAGQALIDKALAIPGWFGMGVLDAATRLVQSMVTAGGIGRGKQALGLLSALFDRTCRATAGTQSEREQVDIYALIPPDYWSVTPDPATTNPSDPRLQLHGAVLLRVVQPATRETRGTHDVATQRPPSPELAAALREKSPHPLRHLWGLLKADGILAPLALAGAIVIAAGAILVETLLFRGLFDMAGILTQPLQRIGAVAGLIAFAAVLLVVQIPIILETARHGRHLETRLRMALLRKLPRLTDRYFHSRPISDMAERSHSIQMARGVPAMGLQLVQVLSELVLTLTGIALIDGPSAPLAGAIAAVAVVLSAGAQPMINERDLRVRNHAGALYGFYLDALLGLVPIRTHGAQQAVSRQHEGLLVEWARSCRGLIRMSLLSGALQAVACTVLAGYLLADHFHRAGAVTGADLLLVYWVLKLPAIGRSISSLAHAYPGQRNALLRLLEPLSAPEDPAAAPAPSDPTAVGSASVPACAGDGATETHRETNAAGIAMVRGRVLAAGHVILRDLDLSIAPGEHVAIVGKSGAGKSTLIGLLLGWHRLAEGTLTVDGKRLAGAGIDALRRRTAWVDPGIQLWNQSFLDNLAYASSGDELRRVGGIVDAAGLRGVLQKLPLGLQTLLGEGGGLLSGGEGQRVRLARALLQRDVSLVLLDEPFRGIDSTQRSRLLGDVRQWWKDVTLLCVTHDVAETLGFARVLVVEAGRILEDGAPSELAARASRYRQLLDAETSVCEQMWQGKQWRRIRMVDGRIESAP